MGQKVHENGGKTAVHSRTELIDAAFPEKLNSYSGPKDNVGFPISHRFLRKRQLQFRARVRF
jgi:hypothetical protein